MANDVQPAIAANQDTLTTSVVYSAANDDPARVLLRVQGLKTHFDTEDGVVQAVDGVDLTLRRGETLGIVGESGSGKSVTSLSILRLIDPPGRIVAGQIMFDGIDLLTLSDEEMRLVRGNRISMIFSSQRRV